MSNIDTYLKLEHDLADLIHAQFVLFRHAQEGPTEDGRDAALRKHERNEERLKRLLELADINQIKRAILGATVIS